ncbi:MAG: leucyl aminopeptidase [Nannocystis sp.]|nr:leucyl aminopeptidase [Nannocystis sp.]
MEPTTIAQRFGDAVATAAVAARFRANAGDRFAFTRLLEGHLQHVILIGLGAQSASAATTRKLAHDAAKAANAVGATHLILDLRGALAPADARRLGALVVEGAHLGLYSYDRYLDAERRRSPALVELSVLSDFKDMSQGAERGGVGAACIARARDLVNGPAELVTPSFLAETARSSARAHAALGLECEVLERDECERRGMGLYLAVARGSAEPPKFIHLRYKPRDDAPTRGRICLIGKGVTFDSGGLSLKPSDAMMGMKMDMAGAAAVIAALEGAALLQLPWEIHAIVAATENMVSGASYRLGDVLRAANGKTVEVDNTDAEGRLTLADALVYAGHLEPDLTIDLATLTGACIVALGPHIAGVMSPDEGLTRAWLDAAQRAGEDMWRLPLPSALKELLKSPIADMRNTGDRAGGSITAGLFLSEFAGDQRWLHVDIAGPAMVKKPYGVTDEGGSGFGVATILELLASDDPILERTPAI